MKVGGLVFIGREQELQFFEDRYRLAGGQLVVLYGRRRIGKTEMLHHFCKDKPHVFYACREVSDGKQLTDFSARLLQAGSPAAKYVSSFLDWEAAFEAVLELPTNGAKKLLIIDELPYMCRGNPSIPSILQILWDEKLKNQNVMIVLCGSAMSFMEKKVLSEKSPLYGRATGVYKMKALPFDDAVQFFPHYSYEDKMLAYAILGGIPHYLRQFDSRLPLRENIIKQVLAKGAVLYSEVEFLIRQELREPALYNTVVEAIALGNTKLNDIYMKTGLEKSKISVYLKNLMDLEIITREFSVTSGVKEQAASTRGLYRITDNFFRFWFHFVFPYLSDLETGDAKGIFDHVVDPGINEFTSPVFEDVCCQFLRKLNRQGLLGFRAAKLGRWWGKLQVAVERDKRESVVTKEAEIDIVAMDAHGKHYLLGECKFKNSESNLGDFEKLAAKTGFVKQGAQVRYALFSKAGFSKELVQKMQESKAVRLFSLADIFEAEPPHDEGGCMK